MNHFSFLAYVSCSNYRFEEEGEKRTSVHRENIDFIHVFINPCVGGGSEPWLRLAQPRKSQCQTHAQLLQNKLSMGINFC